MYKPTVAKIIGKRRYGNDWNFAFESHTGKTFEEDIKWAAGINWQIGDVIGFNRDGCKKFESWEDGMSWIESLTPHT